MIPYGICLSLYDLLHLVWQSLGPYVLLQMALFQSFLWLNSISFVYVPHLLYHSSANGHVGCSHVLAVVNHAAVNWDACILSNEKFPLGRCPGSRIAGSYGNSIFSSYSLIWKNNPIKMSWRPKQIVLQRRYTDGQQAHEKNQYH